MRVTTSRAPGPAAASAAASATDGIPRQARAASDATVMRSSVPARADFGRIEHGQAELRAPASRSAGRSFSAIVARVAGAVGEVGGQAGEGVADEAPRASSAVAALAEPDPDREPNGPSPLRGEGVGEADG